MTPEKPETRKKRSRDRHRGRSSSRRECGHARRLWHDRAPPGTRTTPFHHARGKSNNQVKRVWRPSAPQPPPALREEQEASPRPSRACRDTHLSGAKRGSLAARSTCGLFFLFPRPAGQLGLSPSLAIAGVSTRNGDARQGQRVAHDDGQLRCCARLPMCIQTASGRADRRTERAAWRRSSLPPERGDRSVCMPTAATAAPDSHAPFPVRLCITQKWRGMTT